MRRVKQSILTFSACAVCAILTQVIDFNSGDSETPDREDLPSLTELERLERVIVPGILRGKDVTASIQEIIANQKNPGTLLFVLGASLVNGEEVPVDRVGAKQYLQAAVQFQHPGAAWWLGQMIEEDEPEDKQWLALGYYRLALDLFRSNPAAYSDRVALLFVLKDCRDREARLEAKLNPEERYRALTFVRTKLKELWGM